MKLKDQGLREAINTVNLRKTVNSGFHQIGQTDDEEEEEPHTLNLNPYTLPKFGDTTQEEHPEFNYIDSQNLAKRNHDRVFPSADDPNENTFARAGVDPNKEEFKNSLYQYYSKADPSKSLDPIIQSNLLNYKYEALDIKMTHSMAYSSSYKQSQNLVWDQDGRWIAYTFESVVIVEKLDVERNQKFLKEGNDALSGLKLSPSGKLLMAYTFNASMDGLPMIYVWEVANFKKVAQISINQRIIVGAEFSPNSNLLLVVSFDDTDEDDPNSVVAVWDFLDGN